MNDNFDLNRLISPMALGMAWLKAKATPDGYIC
jgi:hypothetical protein